MHTFRAIFPYIQQNISVIFSNFSNFSQPYRGLRPLLSRPKIPYIPNLISPKSTIFVHFSSPKPLYSKFIWPFLFKILAAPTALGRAHPPPTGAKPSPLPRAGAKPTGRRRSTRWPRCWQQCRGRRGGGGGPNVDRPGWWCWHYKY